ncbi:hypothetical protein, partial [Nonomuraea sp. NPDC050310]|uniref:hypothetical protein n=1 Tax=Nonomuraea sp. NPDC050310 TaxID=3154935 RepID=UPI0033E7292C
ATKTYTFTCKEAPEADVRIADLEVGAYNGSCTTPPQLKASAQLQAAQAGTVEYHWVVDGQAGPKKTQVFQNPGAARVDHVWSSVKPGKVELVVDSHDKPRAETLYKVVCSTENPDPDPVVSIGEITSTDIYGVECPSDSGRVWADVQADRDTEIKLFWTVDGRQVATQTVALTAGRPKRVGAVIRAETTRDVPVVLEVLSFNKPKKSATLKVLCTTVKITDVKASPAEYAGPCKSAPGDTIKLSAVLESDRAQTVKYQWVNGAGVVLRNQTFERVFTKRGSATVEVYLTTRVTFRDTYRVRLVSPQAGYQSETVSFSHVCANAEITQSHVKKDSVRTWCTGEQIPYVMTATIKTESAGTVQWRWVRKSNRTGNQWVAEPWQLTVFNEPGHENVVYNWGTSASEQGDWRLELNAPWSVTSRDHTFTTCLDRN